MLKTKHLFLLSFTILLSTRTFQAQPTCILGGETQQDIVIDLTGQASFDALDDADNTVLTICNMALADKQLTHISWENVLAETVGASWCSEASLSIGQDFPDPGNGVNLMPHMSEAQPGPCTINASSGFIDLTVSGSLVFADPAGCITVQLYESFDDVANTADATFLSGTVTLSGCGVPEAIIPTLGEWGIIILGLIFVITGVVFIKSHQFQFDRKDSRI